MLSNEDDDFYPAKSILQYKTSTFLGFARQRYSLILPNGDRIIDCLFDIPEYLLQDPIKLTRSILFHTEFDTYNNKNAMTPCLYIYDFLWKTPEDYDATIPRLMMIFSEVKTTPINEFLVLVLSGLLGAKSCILTSNPTKHKYPNITKVFTSEIQNYDERYKWYKQKCNEFRPYLAEAIGFLRKKQRALAMSKFNRSIIGEFLTKFVGMSKGDIDYTFRSSQIEYRTVSLDVLSIEQGSLLQHIPEYNKNNYIEVITNGVIVDGICSICWLSQYNSKIVRDHDHK